MSELDKMDRTIQALILVRAAERLPKGSDKRLEFLAAAQDLLGPESLPGERLQQSLAPRIDDIEADIAALMAFRERLQRG